MANIEERLSRVERTFAQLKGGGLVLGLVVLGFLGIGSFVYIPEQVKTTVKSKIDSEVEREIEDQIGDTIKQSESVSQLLFSAVQGELEGQLSDKLRSVVPEAVNLEISKNLPDDMSQVISRIESNSQIAQGAAERLSELAIEYDKQILEGVVGISEYPAHGYPHPQSEIVDNPRTGITMKGIVNGRVNFESPFKTVPAVMIGLKKVDVYEGKNTRINVSVTSVDLEGFNYALYSWSDTHIYTAEASWIAIPRNQ